MGATERATSEEIETRPAVQPEADLRHALVVPYQSHDVNVRKKAHQSIRQRLASMLEVPNGLLVQLCQRHCFLRLMSKKQDAVMERRRLSQAAAVAEAALVGDMTPSAIPVTPQAS